MPNPRIFYYAALILLFSSFVFEKTFPLHLNKAFAFLEAPFGTEYTSSFEKKEYDVFVDTDNVTKITCPNDTIVYTDPNSCHAEVSIAINVDAFESVTNDFNGSSNATGIYPVGTTRITWTAVDTLNRISTCKMNVVVIDNETPIIICPNDVSAEIDSALFAHDIHMPTPTILDNCSSLSINSFGNDLMNTLNTYPLGVTQITWSVSDAGGNMATCEMNIDITYPDSILNNATCPNDTVVYTDRGRCDAFVTIGSFGSFEYLENDYNWTSDATGIYPVGITKVTWIAVDAANDTSICEMNIEVIDTFPPTIICPNNVRAETDSAHFACNIPIPSPAARDNCSAIAAQHFSNNFTRTSDASGTYPFGITPINWEVTDESGNVASCRMDVIVSDSSYGVDDLGGLYYKHQIIVEFDDSVSLAQKNSLRAEYAAVKLDTCMCGAYLQVWELTDTDSTDIECTIKAIRGKPIIKSVGFNYETYVTPSSQGAVGYQDPANQNSKVKVAIIDTGIDIMHPRLSQFIAENNAPVALCMGNDPKGVNFIDRNESPIDDHGHGTHMAGIVVGAANQDFCPTEVSLLNLKTHDSTGRGSLFAVVCAIHYALRSEVDMINASLGYYGQASEVLENAIAQADSTVLIVTSAGNDSLNTDTNLHFPSNYCEKYKNIISVAAIDEHDNLLCDFSNYGLHTVELVANGLFVPSALPNNGWDELSGTSQAAALCTKAAVLAKLKYPALSARGLKNYLLNSVEYIHTLGNSIVTGGKIPDSLLVRGSSCGRDVFEPNNDSITAQFLPSNGVNRNAMICPLDDEDWYLFYGSSGSRIQVRLSNLSVNHDLEVYKQQVRVDSSYEMGITDEVIVFDDTLGGIYMIRVFNQQNCKNNPDSYTLNVAMNRMASRLGLSSSDSLKSHPSVLSIDVYPNPAKEWVTVQINSELDCQVDICITDVMGRVAWKTTTFLKEGANQQNIPLTNFPQGIYLLNVMKEEWKEYKRFVKE